MKFNKGRSKTVILIFVLMNSSKILAQAGGFNSNRAALNFVKTSTILSTVAAFAPTTKRNVSSKRLVENRYLSSLTSKSNYNCQKRGVFSYPSISKSSFTTSSIKGTSGNKENEKGVPVSSSSLAMGYLDENISEPSSYSIPPFKKGDDMLTDLPKGTRIISFGDVHGDILALYKFLQGIVLYKPRYAFQFDGNSFRLSFPSISTATSREYNHKSNLGWG